MEHDALGAHARDELGISEIMSARPLQAAFASAGTFTVGALLALAALGILSARVGGARTWVATGRIVFWGALAMSLTAAVGRWFGAVV